MLELTTCELKATKGGFKLGIAAGIIAGITFIIGLIDGYVRPQACR